MPPGCYPIGQIPTGVRIRWAFKKYQSVKSNAIYLYRLSSIYQLFRVIQFVHKHFQDVQTKNARAVDHCTIAICVRHPKRALRRVSW